MFENLFPILGQLVTTALVGGLLGAGVSFIAAHLFASARRTRSSVSPRAQLSA